MTTYDQRDAARAACHLLDDAIGLIEQAVNMNGLDRGPATTVMGEALVALMAAENLLWGRPAQEEA